MEELVIKQLPCNNNVIVLHLSGKIRLGKGSVVLRNTILSVLQQSNKIILDFTNLMAKDGIDANGIGALIACMTTIESNAGVLVLLQATQELYDKIAALKLLDSFTFTATQPEAFQYINGKSLSRTV